MILTMIRSCGTKYCINKMIDNKARILLSRMQIFLPGYRYSNDLLGLRFVKDYEVPLKTFTFFESL